MNSDSFFESEFIQEHKGLIAVFITASLAFLTIFWLYKGLKSNAVEGANNVIIAGAGGANTGINGAQISNNNKRRLSITANNILFNSFDKIDLANCYQLLDKLSQSYDLYVVILIEENDDQNKILEKLEDLFEDKIIYRHVKIVFINIL
jgi:hypothetical protein